MKVRGILETCIYAEDLEAAEEFYTGIIGLEVVGKESGRHLFFRCGQSMLLVFNPLRTCLLEAGDGAEVVPPHGARGSSHLAFSVAEGDFPEWRLRLARLGIEIEKEITWPGGGLSIYFRDPAGNSLELATASVWGRR